MARRPKPHEGSRPRPAPRVPVDALRRTFHVKCGPRTGTGFAIDVDNRQYLVTAAHLLRALAAGAVLEILHGGRWKPLDAQVVGYGPPQIDVAVLTLKFRIALPDARIMPTSAGLALGQDIWCLGFPGLEWLAGAGATQRFPTPFVKKLCVASLPDSAAAVRILYLEGCPNQGFSGGPVIGGAGEDAMKLAGVLSTLEYEGEPVCLGTEHLRVSAQRNPDLAVAYDVKHVLDVISLNPIGFEL